jgi:hypothetical protein
MNRFLSRRWPDCLIAALLFAISLAVHSATLITSLSYKSPNGNELATIPYLVGLANSTGDPLCTWLGKLFTYLPMGMWPIGSTCCRPCWERPAWACSTGFA